MKRFVSVLACIFISVGLLCSCGSDASDGGATGLRDIKWGMTRTEVRKLETAEFAGYDDSFLRFYDEDTNQPLVYLGVNTKNKVDLRYFFNSDDKLFKIQYKLATPSLTETSYKHVKLLMNDSYGEPYAEDVLDPEDEYTHTTSWKSAKSDITLSYTDNAASLNTMLVTFLPNN